MWNKWILNFCLTTQYTAAGMTTNTLHSRSIVSNLRQVHSYPKMTLNTIRSKVTHIGVTNIPAVSPNFYYVSIYD